jgi:hypothetical protein
LYVIVVSVSEAQFPQKTGHAAATPSLSQLTPYLLRSEMAEAHVAAGTLGVLVQYTVARCEAVKASTAGA